MDLGVEHLEDALWSDEIEHDHAGIDLHGDLERCDVRLLHHARPRERLRRRLGAGAGSRCDEQGTAEGVRREAAPVQRRRIEEWLCGHVRGLASGHDGSPVRTGLRSRRAR